MDKLPRYSWRFLLGAAALAMPLHGASADFRDGNHLYQNCTDQANYSAYGACVGYVMAVADAIGFQPFNGLRACLPPTASAKQSVDVVAEYLRSHSAQRHLAATTLVAVAISQAFPCK